MLTHFKIFRLTKNIKLTAIAQETGLSISFLSRIENGKLQGKKETRRKIAKALGISEEILFGKNG